MQVRTIQIFIRRRRTDTILAWHCSRRRGFSSFSRRATKGSRTHFPLFRRGAAARPHCVALTSSVDTVPRRLSAAAARYRFRLFIRLRLTSTEQPISSAMRVCVPPHRRRRAGGVCVPEISRRDSERSTRGENPTSNGAAPIRKWGKRRDRELNVCLCRAARVCAFAAAERVCGARNECIRGARITNSLFHLLMTAYFGRCVFS